MGYTHYYNVPIGTHEQDKWDTFIEDCKTLYKRMPNVVGQGDRKAPLMLSGCFKYKEPVFNSTKVYFNGARSLHRVKKTAPHGDTFWEDGRTEDDMDLSHETFVITRVSTPNTYSKEEQSSFNFCKTAGKPYDLMVTACLLLYKFYFPKVELSSDGTAEDWKTAVTFIGNVFPERERTVSIFRNQLG